MIKHLFLLVSILACSMIQAQTLIGKVMDTAGQGVAFANIYFLNSTLSAVADENGQYQLDIASGTYTLQCSAVGFATKILDLSLNNDSQKLDITLSQSAETLSEVIVTANKVETNLQRTPLAITSLDAKKIEEYRVWNITDLTALAPSTFTVEHGNTTGSNFFNIRGTLGFTGEQSVATYVDGVYQFDFFSAPLNFSNIESIEILRGPQGTLYGRNAFSGVVNIITKRPVNKTSGFAGIDIGNYGQQRYSLGFNTPLIKNKLFVNIGLQSNKRGAIFENPTINTEAFDSRQAYNGNLGLKYLLNNHWSIDLNARIENNTDKGGYPWVATDSIARNEPFKTFGNWDNTEKRRNINVSMAAKYFGQNFNFTSITSVIDFDIWFPGRFDFDFTALKLISGQVRTEQNQITQEFRISSPASDRTFRWTVGSFLFSEKAKNITSTFYEEDFAFFDPSAPYSTITNGKRDNKGLAFFGQGSYSIASNLDITIGARYDTEQRNLTQNSAFEKDGFVLVTATDSTNTANYSAFTPKVILDYNLNNTTMLYASFAKGFRVGGFNYNNPTNPTYAPEKSDNYEVGIKNNLFNNQLKVNITAFYLQQKDQQVTTTQDGINYATLNVGDMNNLGLEAEVSAIPLKNLQIEWNASTSRSRYAKLELFDAATLSTKNYIDNQAIYNPAFQSMLAIQYGIPLSKSVNNYKAFLRGEYRYVGEYQLNFENTESQKAYGMANLRAGITSDHFDISVWARNINDVRYMAWGTFGSYMLGSPRMLGVSLAFKL